DDRSSSSPDRVRVVFRLPGKFQALRIVVRRDAIMKIPMDSSKLKLASMVLSEGDVSWNHEVDGGFIPLFHLDNPPCSPIRIAHRVLLYRRLLTPPAYSFSTLLRNVANALANLVLCCWSMRYSLAVASK